MANMSEVQAPVYPIKSRSLREGRARSFERSGGNNHCISGCHNSVSGLGVRVVIL